jgi:hypothetical protein
MIAQIKNSQKIGFIIILMDDIISDIFDSVPDLSDQNEFEVIHTNKVDMVKITSESDVVRIKRPEYELLKKLFEHE